MKKQEVSLGGILRRFISPCNEGFCPKGKGKTRKMEFSGCANSRGWPLPHQRAEILCQAFQNRSRTHSQGPRGLQWGETWGMMESKPLVSQTGVYVTHSSRSDDMLSPRTHLKHQSLSGPERWCYLPRSHSRWPRWSQAIFPTARVRFSQSTHGEVERGTE